MTPALSAASRWGSVRVLAIREATSAIHGMGGYVALSAAVLAAAWVLLIDMRGLATSGVLVLTAPFRSSLAVAILILALYLAISAAASAARDRETGTLEVLFYGPVDEISYVLGKMGGLLAAYAAALPILLVCLALLSLASGFALTSDIVASMALSIVPAAEVISFGVLLSVGADRVRTAVLVLITVAALLIGLTFAKTFVQLIPIENASSPVLPLRDFVVGLDAALQWISPFALMERIVDGAITGAWRTCMMGLLAAIFWTALMIGLAAYWLRLRGVYRRGE